MIWRAGLVTALLVMAMPAVAAEASPSAYINLGGPSHHFSDREFVEDNFGLGIEVPVGGLLVGAGVYKNSLGRTSRYLVAEKCMISAGPLCLGALAGLVDGYYLNNGNAIPMVAPTVTVDAGRFGLRFVFIPEVEKRVSAVLAVQFRIKIGG